MSKPEIICSFTDLPVSKQNHIFWMYLHIELNSSSLKLQQRNKIYTIWLHMYIGTSDYLLLSGLHFCAWMTQFSFTVYYYYRVIYCCQRGMQEYASYATWRSLGITLELFLMCHCLFSLDKLCNHCGTSADEARVRRELLMLIALGKSILQKQFLL